MKLSNFPNFPNFSQLKSKVVNNNIIIGLLFLLIIGFKFHYDGHLRFGHTFEDKFITSFCLTENPPLGCSFIKPTISTLRLMVLLSCFFSFSVPIYSRFFPQEK